MLANYLRMALKVLARRKFFTVVSLFGIAFTLAVLLVVTAMLDETLRPGPPEVHANRMLFLSETALHGPHWSRHSTAGYALLDRHVRSLAGMERFSATSEPDRVVGFQDGRRIESFLRLADGEYWKILEFEFLEGGPYGIEDEAAANRVAVINESTREEYFGDEPALGRSIDIDGRSFRITGVVRDVPITRWVAFAEIWTPISTAKNQSFRTELVGDFVGVILAPTAAAIPDLKADYQRLLAGIPLDPGFERIEGQAETYLETYASEIFGRDNRSRAALLAALIAGAMLTFMLLPAINLVNLNLSRILERGPEIGVRRAFGASSRALVAQFLIENLVLTAIGALAGLALAGLALDVVNRSGLIPYARFALNPIVFGWGVLLTLVFGFVSGVWPAWKMSRLDPARVLGGRTP